MSVDGELGLLLKEQAELQELMGHNFEDMDGRDVARYIREQALAIIKEVTEALDETPWKPWATYPIDAEINEDAYVGELADVLIFFLNLMLAGDVSERRLLDAVRAKIAKNRDRHASAYDGHWATVES